MKAQLYHGDCLDVIPTLEAESVDTVITDPPAGISFMGKKWDNKTGYVARTDKGMRFLEFGELMGLEPWEAGFVAFMIDVLIETYRVMKPGAMCLIWALPRTADLTGLAMRVAGLQVRDVITHLFGSGFPKSHDISKAMDRVAGAEREVIGRKVFADGSCGRKTGGDFDGSLSDSIDRTHITAPATESAKLWDGYGTALKPACEFWLLGMKPLDGTFANNAIEHGVAGLWIDGGRIRAEQAYTEAGIRMPSQNAGTCFGQAKGQDESWHKFPGNSRGRFPANLILSHHPECVQVGVRKVKSPGMQKGTSKDYGGTVTNQVYNKRPQVRSDGYANPDGTETIPAYDCHPDCPVRLLGEQSGNLAVPKTYKRATAGEDAFGAGVYSSGKWRPEIQQGYGDTGTAARYFLNLEGETRFLYCAKSSRRERTCDGEIENGHPTVKPVNLMKYFCTLTRTPTGGVVLDPFMGSGTTGVACVETERDFIGIERGADSMLIARARIGHAQNETIQGELELA